MQKQVRARFVVIGVYVVDPVQIKRQRTPFESVDLVAFGQQQFR